MPSKTYEIPPFMELSVRVGYRGSLELTVKQGFGEVFGSPLVPDHTYTFPGGRNFPVHTYDTGCSVLVEGARFTCELKENCNTQLHWALSQKCEKLCQGTEARNQHRPAVMIVGPQDQGKTSLCKLLINYSVRTNRNPQFVDLDVGQNAISLPGTMCMVAVQQVLDPVREFDDLTPRAFHFGHKSPADNKVLYKELLATIAYMSKVHANPNEHAPCFINTCGWVRDFGFEALMEAAMQFEVACVIVIGDQELAAQLQQRLPACAEIISVKKAGGVVHRERNFRGSGRILKVQQYFNGVDGTFQTHQLKLPFGKIQVFRAGKITLRNNNDEGSHEDRLPAGDLHLVPFQQLRPDTVLSVMEDSFPRHGPHSCLLGYVIVSSINMESQIMEVCSPVKDGDKMTKFLAMNYLGNSV